MSHQDKIKLFKQAEQYGGYWFIKVYLPSIKQYKRAYILSLAHALELFPENSIFEIMWLHNEYCISLDFEQSDGIIVKLYMYTDKDFFNGKNT